MLTSVLVVEDDVSLRETIRFNLEREGYDVHTASDGESGLGMARSLDPDLIILDVMLPVLNGTEVLRQVRSESDVPVLLLTARTSEIDRVQGLDLGADDYITKPFGLAELLARVRAHLRRSAGGTVGAVVEFGGKTLDLARRELRRGEQVIPLRPKEYQLLVYLAGRPGRTFTRDELLNDVWDIDFAGGTRTVDVHIRWLRQKIEETPSEPRHLITVRGTGYRFEL
jgi:DNA-binding response OmpR family regulator